MNRRQARESLATVGFVGGMFVVVLAVMFGLAVLSLHHLVAALLLMLAVIAAWPAACLCRLIWVALFGPVDEAEKQR